METHRHYYLVEQAIHYLRVNHRAQPSLEELAAQAHLSPFHFQRVFTEWAGISPKRFLQYLNKSYLQGCLHSVDNLEVAAERTGLSSQSRVYDLFVKLEALTPQEFRSGGEGVSIDWGIHASPFGDCFIAATERGVCSLQFVDDGESAMTGALLQQWPAAQLRHNPAVTQALIARIFSRQLRPASVSVLVNGTNFQIKVWEALLRIPFGSLRSYQQIAASIGQPSASRAVGSAVAKNPVGFLIPCHRVIRQQGVVGEYRWGAERKQALIGWEAAKKVAALDKNA